MNELFESFPVINGEKIHLGKIDITHLDDVFSIYSNEIVFKYCGITPRYNKDTVEKMIGHFERDYHKRSKVKWGIFLNQSSNKLVGILEAFDFNQKVNMVTIGYYLEPTYWGQGIASEAVSLLTVHLFEEVHVNRIQAEVMIENEGSKRVLTKNGYIKEGTLRQANVWTGKGIVDLEIYAILKQDYLLQGQV